MKVQSPALVDIFWDIMNKHTVTVKSSVAWAGVGLAFRRGKIPAFPNEATSHHHLRGNP